MKKRIVGLFMVLALALGIAGVSGVQKSVAAGTVKHSVVLFAGEKYPQSIEKGKIKKIKSSNKAVVKTKKDSANLFTIVAKKAGSAVVTVKTSKGKHIYNVSVEDVNFRVSQESLYVLQSFTGSKFNSKMTFKVENKTKIHIGSATVKYTLTDTKGVDVETGSFIVNSMVPGGTAYYSVDYTMQDTALASSKAEVISWMRDPNVVCTDQSSKIDVKQDASDKSVFTIKNNADTDVAGNADILFRDGQGAVIYMECASFFFSAGEDTKYTLSYLPSSYAKVDISVRAASTVQ